MAGFGCCINSGSSFNEGVSFGGGNSGSSFSRGGFQGQGQGPPAKKKEPEPTKYCMKDILDAIKKIESGGEENPCKAVALEGGKPFSFGFFQISKANFKAATITFTEKCGIECEQYKWLHNGIPSVMCKNDADAARAEKWSRCVVISYMWRYANRAGRGVHPGNYVGPGALDAPHNESPWMNARVRGKGGKTDVRATAKNRKKMTDSKGNPKPEFTKKNGKQHGDWPPGGSKFGAKSKTAKKGAIDRLCECKGTKEDCELVARIHNGGQWSGNYHDNRKGKTKWGASKSEGTIPYEESSRRRWDNSTNYWDKIQRELKPTGK